MEVKTGDNILPEESIISYHVGILQHTTLRQDTSMTRIVFARGLLILLIISVLPTSSRAAADQKDDAIAVYEAIAESGK